MIEPLTLLGIGSLKVIVLLAAASVAAQILSRRPARLRAVVWATALVGALVMPAAALLLPRMEIQVPSAFKTVKPEKSTTDRPSRSAATLSVENAGRTIGLGQESAKPVADRQLDWATGAMVLWFSGTTVLLLHLGVGLARIRRTLKGAVPVTDRNSAAILDVAIRRVGCRRSLRLLTSPDIEIPATVGAFNPTVLIPSCGKEWSQDRLMAVLLHELVHVRRMDWALRILARIAKAFYWFIPLTWWAVRRLDLEQELACDEEVVALGTSPAAYADHLLAIARAAALNPAPAIPGMAMARTPDLEKRIMTLLKNTNHRRVGIAVLVPAVVLVAAMVSALAAVSPSEPGNSNPPYSEKADSKTSEIGALMAEMKAAEKELEHHLQGVETRAMEIEKKIEAIEPIEIDEEAIAEIERAMEPHLERIRDIEIDMAPFEAEMAKLEEKLESLELHIEDGTLEDIQRQIDEQIGENLKMIELSHEAMVPHLEALELAHLDLEEFHQQMEKIQLKMEPQQEALEQMHREMQPLHEDLDRLREEMAPIEERMEKIGRRLDAAIATEVADALKSRLAAVTDPGAPFQEAARRIVDGARIRIDKNLIEIQSPLDDNREVLQDLFTSHRIGTEDAFNTAITSAASDFENFRIQIE